MSVAAKARRIVAQGCERPGACEWFRIVHFKMGVDYLGLNLCDFHTECRREGLKLSFRLQRPVTPVEAISRHPAAWRAHR